MEKIFFWVLIFWRLQLWCAFWRSFWCSEKCLAEDLESQKRLTQPLDLKLSPGAAEIEEERVPRPKKPYIDTGSGRSSREVFIIILTPIETSCFKLFYRYQVIENFQKINLITITYKFLLTWIMFKFVIKILLHICLLTGSKRSSSSSKLNFRVTDSKLQNFAHKVK